MASLCSTFTLGLTLSFPYAVTAVENPFAELAAAYAELPSVAMTATTHMRFDANAEESFCVRRQSLTTLGPDFKFAAKPQIAAGETRHPGRLGRTYVISYIAPTLDYLDLDQRLLERFLLASEGPTVPFSSDTPALLEPFAFLAMRNGERSDLNVIHWSDLTRSDYLDECFASLEATALEADAQAGIDGLAVSLPYRDIDLPNSQHTALNKLPSRIVLTFSRDIAQGPHLLRVAEWRPEGQVATLRCTYRYDTLDVTPVKPVPVLVSSELVHVPTGVVLLKTAGTTMVQTDLTKEDLRIDPVEARLIHDRESGTFLGN